MRHVLSPALLFLAALAVLLPASADQPAPEYMMEKTKAAVLKTEAIRTQALLDADVGTLDRITAEEYVHVESSGKLRTKQQFLDGLRDAEYRFESFVIDENNIQMLGDVAVATGRYHNVIKTREGVQPVKYARHVRVYDYRDGRWMNVTHQATEMPAAE